MDSRHHFQDGWRWGWLFGMWVGFAIGLASGSCSAQTIGVWGDSQGNYFGRFTTHAHHLASRRPDYLLGLGDYVQNGRPEEWAPHLFAPLVSAFAGRFPKDAAIARGNHDAQWFQHFGPVYGWSVFARTWGHVRLLVLDSNGDYPTVQLRPLQEAWLRAQLSSPAWTQARYRVVAMHHPYRTEIWAGCYAPEDAWLRDKLVLPCVNAGADVIFAAHAHAYQRGKIGNTAWIISGGGGGWIDADHCWDWPEVTVAKSVHHYGLLDAKDASLTWKAFDLNNQTIDQVTIR